VGKEDEIFGQSLEVQSEVLNFICPKGITLDVKEELMEAATDVCALPGKLKGNDASSTMEALGATISDLNSRNARCKNTIPREAQWQNSNRNALGNIKTFKELVSCTNELGAQRKQVIKNMHNRMTNTLFHAGWEVEEANLYYQAGLPPNIVRLTMDHYWELFTHLQSVATMQVNNWEAAKIHLQHHADKLRVIHDNASTRNQMLVQNHVYLRDAVASEFHSSSLTGKFMETMQDQMKSLLATIEVGGARPKTPNPNYPCAHCHSAIHEGGQNMCPLTKIKPKKARAMVAAIAAKILEDPDNADDIIHQALEQET
jgi:hypothetical protein